MEIEVRHDDLSDQNILDWGLVDPEVRSGRAAVDRGAVVCRRLSRPLLRERRRAREHGRDRRACGESRTGLHSPRRAQHHQPAAVLRGGARPTSRSVARPGCRVHDLRRPRPPPVGSTRLGAFSPTVRSCTGMFCSTRGRTSPPSGGATTTRLARTSAPSTARSVTRPRWSSWTSFPRRPSSKRSATVGRWSSFRAPTIP